MQFKRVSLLQNISSVNDPEQLLQLQILKGGGSIPSVIKMLLLAQKKQNQQQKICYMCLSTTRK